MVSRKKEKAMAEIKFYARPEGWHYHTDRNCSMLAGGDFERLGYVEITLKEAKKRKLRPCACADKRHFCIVGKL